MCLAIPGKIKKINQEIALVDFAGVKKEVGLQLLPQAKVGDYVIVHAGFAIQILNEREARESLSAWEELRSEVSPTSRGSRRISGQSPRSKVRSQQ